MVERSEYKLGVFCWVDVIARDARALQQFYTQLFGWTALPRKIEGGPEYLIFKHKGKSICGLGQMPFMMKVLGMPAMWNSYINVADVNVAVDKACAFGASVMMPAMDVMTAGRMAFLKDPEGASFAVWQKRDHFGAELVSEVGTWGWNELMTRNPAKAEQFYGELFGWTFADVNEDPKKHYRLIQQPTADDSMKAGLLPITPEMGNLSASWSVYFIVDELNVTLEKLKALGGKVNVEPFTIEVGEIAVVVDPQGGVFNLIWMSVPPCD